MDLRAKTFWYVIALAFLVACSANTRSGFVPQTNNTGSLRPQIVQRGNGAQFQTIAAGGNFVWSIASNAYYTFAPIAQCIDSSCFEGRTYYDRIADDGSITQADPNGNCYHATGQIIAAYDNSMWMPDGNWLCRISADGSSSQEYPVTAPPARSGLFVSAVVAGADRNVWFNDFNNPRIGKMSLAGSTLAIYGLPSGVPPVSSLSAGPDGNMWMAAGNAIVKSTTSGQMRKFAVPYYVDSIKNAGDGLLYFLYGQPGQNWSGIGTITTSGGLKYYPFPGSEAKCDGLGTCYVGSGLTVGPFGNLWFESPHGIQAFSHTAHTYSSEISTPFGVDSTTTKYAFGYGNDNNLWFYGGSDSSGQALIAIDLIHRMTVSPTSLSLSVGGSAPVHASEAYFTGTFLTQSSNTAVATVAPASTRGTFTITAHSKGSATITIADGPNSSQNNRVNVAVSVH